MQEKRREYHAQKAQADKALEMSKRSLSAQRSRFERALGVSGGEDSTSNSLDEELEDEAETLGSLQEDDIDTRWQYDKAALREWESFIKKSKSAQVSSHHECKRFHHAYWLLLLSFICAAQHICERICALQVMEDQWWDIDSSVEGRQPASTLLPPVDWNS